LNFIKYLKKLIPSTIFDMLTNFIVKGINKFPHPYGEEVAGIANALDIPLCKNFYIFYGFFLDTTLSCQIIWKFSDIVKHYLDRISSFVSSFF